MWIRTQDKTRLLESHEFYIETLPTYTTLYAVCNNKNLKVGRFRSEAKALQVISNIEKRINQLRIDGLIRFDNYSSLTNDQKQKILSLSSVFDIPGDDK